MFAALFWVMISDAYCLHRYCSVRRAWSLLICSRER
jgi:hypothetical protein